MSRKLIIISFVFLSITSVLFTGCNNKAQDQTKVGLKVYSWNSSLGGINQNNLDKSKFSYSIELTNNNDKNIFIKSVVPNVNETIKSRLLSKEIVVEVNKNVNLNETIQINGEIIFDTTDLTKEEIVKLEPFIKNIKVSTEETVSLNIIQ